MVFGTCSPFVDAEIVGEEAQLVDADWGGVFTEDGARREARRVEADDKDVVDEV